MQTKNGKTHNFEDSKYCYVILRRGQRPKLSTEITSTNVDKPSDNKRGEILVLCYRCLVFQELILILLNSKLFNRFNS